LGKAGSAVDPAARLQEEHLAQARLTWTHDVLAVAMAG
jgi:hypothetical protein